jgi:hypothetical protein
MKDYWKFCVLQLSFWNTISKNHELNFIYNRYVLLPGISQPFLLTYNLSVNYIQHYRSTDRNFLKKALEQHSDKIIRIYYSLEYDNVIYPIHLRWCIWALMNMLVSKYHSHIPFLHKCYFSHLTSYHFPSHLSSSVYNNLHHPTSFSLCTVTHHLQYPKSSFHYFEYLKWVKNRN